MSASVSNPNCLQIYNVIHQSFPSSPQPSTHLCGLAVPVKGGPRPGCRGSASRAHVILIHSSAHPACRGQNPGGSQTCRMVKGRQDQVPTHAVPWHLLSPDSLTEEKKKNQGFIRSQKLQVCVIPSQNIYSLKKCIRLNTFTYRFLHFYWSMVA